MTAHSHPPARMSHDRCTRPHFHPVSLQAQRGSWHETRTPPHGLAAEARGCTGYASRSVFRLSPRPEAGRKIQVASSTGKLPNAAAASQAAAPRKRTAYRSPTSAAARSRFASSSAEETDRIPVADQRSCAQPPTPTAPAPRALASAAAAERRAAAAASSRQQQRRAASGSSNGEQPCASSHIKL